MKIGWNQVWGVGLVAVGVCWLIRLNVPVGIEGRPASFHAKRKWAALLGIAAIVFGLVVALEIINLF
jgi:hypothetical protein